jgi:hypothetical protein
MSMKLTIFSILYLILCAFVAVYVLLIEPIDGVIFENSLPLKINKWAIVQGIILFQIVVSAIWATKNITDSWATRKNIHKTEIIQTNDSVPHKEDGLFEHTKKEDQIKSSVQIFEEKLNLISSKIPLEKDKAEKFLWELCKEVEACQAVLYHRKTEDIMSFTAGYAFIKDENSILEIHEGDGLHGQVMKVGNKLWLKEIPKGYLKVISGLGEANPNELLILPYKRDKEVEMLVELAFFKELNTEEINRIELLFQSMCMKINIAELN